MYDIRDVHAAKFFDVQIFYSNFFLVAFYIFTFRDAGLISAQAAKFFNVQIFYSNFFVTFFTFSQFLSLSLHFCNFCSVFIENEKQTPQWRESSNYL